MQVGRGTATFIGFYLTSDSVEAVRSFYVRALGKLGCQRVVTAEPRDTLKFLSTSLGLSDLPVLPQVHDGRHESLVMVKPDGDGRRWVLRLWPAWRSLDPGAVPLWLGNVGRQERRELVGMLAYPVTTDGFRHGLGALARDLGWPQMRAPDPPQVLVRTKWRNALLASRLHFALIVPRGSTAQSLTAHPNGTGPYRLVEWKRGVQIVLEAKEEYWKALSQRD